MTDKTGFSTRLARLESRIAEAEEKAGRLKKSVRLVVINKTQQRNKYEEAFDAGITCFGENKTLSRDSKSYDFFRDHPFVEIYYIGKLPITNVVKAMDVFDSIDTLDRSKLALALSKAFKKSGRHPRLMIRVKAGREPYQTGVRAEDLKFLLEQCKKIFDLPVAGLMCIPPPHEDPTPYFSRLKELADCHGLKEISMGTSVDFEKAIACGATEIKIGSALWPNDSLMRKG